jgi:hypothetical protein
MDESTPALVSFDCPSLGWDHRAAGWRPFDEDRHAMRHEVALMGLGATACPTCSYLDEGRCPWCEAEHDFPECSGCVGRTRVVPWYQRSEILVPVLTTVAVTVVGTVLSTIVLSRIGAA